MLAERNAAAFAESIRASFERKATHNKTEALLCFSTVIGCSLLAPMFVTLGEGLVWGKIIPSALSLLAAGMTTWLQLRKPQQLWALYRTCQRRLEYQQAAFTYAY